MRGRAVAPTDHATDRASERTADVCCAVQERRITYELNVSHCCPQSPFIPDSRFLRIPVNDDYSEKLLPHFPSAFSFLGRRASLPSTQLTLPAYLLVCLSAGQCDCDCDRTGAQGASLCPGPLFGRRLALRHRRHRLRHAAPVAVVGGGVPFRQEQAARHLSQLQLPGTAAAVGARTGGGRCGCGCGCADARTWTDGSVRSGTGQGRGESRWEAEARGEKEERR